MINFYNEIYAEAPLEAGRHVVLLSSGLARLAPRESPFAPFEPKWLRMKCYGYDIQLQYVLYYATLYHGML